jgi:hypothetical protein
MILAVTVDAASVARGVTAYGASVENQCGVFIVNAATVRERRTAVGNRQCGNGNAFTGGNVKDAAVAVAIHSEIISAGT